jgi:hypothetical protein
MHWGDLSKGKKREEEEECWGFIGAASLLDLMPGNGRIQEELSAAVSGAGRSKVEDDLTGGVHESVKKRNRRGGYRFGFLNGPRLARLELGYWQVIGPRVGPGG